MKYLPKGLAIASAVFLCIFAQAAPAFAASGAILSPNWSGYAAQGASYSGVGATWTVPRVASSQTSTASADSTWVGIGGIGRSDLIQAGTLAISASGAAQYHAWYELLPSYPTIIPIAVRAGDSVSASVVKQPDGLWLVRFANRTTGESFRTSVAYASSQASAEWIEEAPKSGGTYMPLSDYGSVRFSETWTIADGTMRTAQGAGAKTVVMHDASGRHISRPFAFDADGAGFTVARVAAPAAAQGMRYAKTAPPPQRMIAARTDELVSTTGFAPVTKHS